MPQSRCRHGARMTRRFSLTRHISCPHRPTSCRCTTVLCRHVKRNCPAGGILSRFGNTLIAVAASPRVRIFPRSQAGGLGTEASRGSCASRRGAGPHASRDEARHPPRSETAPCMCVPKPPAWERGEICRHRRTRTLPPAHADASLKPGALQ